MLPTRKIGKRSRILHIGVVKYMNIWIGKTRKFGWAYRHLWWRGVDRVCQDVLPYYTRLTGWLGSDWLQLRKVLLVEG